MQLVFGILCLVAGVFLLARSVWRGEREGAERPKGIFGRLGGIMVGLVLALFGVALLLPARNADPVPGANTNPVDEAVEEGGAEGSEESGEGGE